MQVNVAVREAGPGAGLGLFAARDVQQGEVLLSLPTDLAFSRKANGVMVRLKGSRQQSYRNEWVAVHADWAGMPAYFVQ
jgi:hypothetical protein